MKSIRDKGEEVQEYKLKFGKNMKILRKAMGLKADDFTRKINLTISNLNRIEKGDAVYIGLDTLYKLGKETNLNNLFKEDLSKISTFPKTKEPEWNGKADALIEKMIIKKALEKVNAK
jgi:transcriptional regulator with XRE-family HTH domain